MIARGKEKLSLKSNVLLICGSETAGANFRYALYCTHSNGLMSYYPSREGEFSRGQLPSLTGEGPQLSRGFPTPTACTSHAIDIVL